MSLIEKFMHTEKADFLQRCELRRQLLDNGMPRDCIADLHFAYHETTPDTDEWRGVIEYLRGFYAAYDTPRVLTLEQPQNAAEGDTVRLKGRTRRYSVREVWKNFVKVNISTTDKLMVVGLKQSDIEIIERAQNMESAA
jgi:hypothetical protein